MKRNKKPEVVETFTSGSGYLNLYSRWHGRCAGRKLNASRWDLSGEGFSFSLF